MWGWSSRRRSGGSAVEVTVLEFGTQLLGREDPDVAAAVRTIFEEDGIDVVLGADTQARGGPLRRVRCAFA